MHTTRYYELCTQHIVGNEAWEGIADHTAHGTLHNLAVDSGGVYFGVPLDDYGSASGDQTADLMEDCTLYSGVSCRVPGIQLLM